MAGDLTIIRSCANEIEALVAQATLDAAGIRSLLLRDDAGGMQPALAFVHGVRLAVRSDDAARAERVLTDREASLGGRSSGDVADAWLESGSLDDDLDGELDGELEREFDIADEIHDEDER
jgi:hypothetical protein